MARRHQENFPVASLLLPKEARRNVRALYQFARGADDVADDPALPPEERTRRLRVLDEALSGRVSAETIPSFAAPLLALCREGTCNAEDARDLLRAFLQDQHVTRCPDWPSMLDYCRYSAVPVGRMFLALCGERQADPEALEALCICLQLLNHLQDLRTDYRDLNRIYLPADWLAEAGVEGNALGAPAASPALRRVLHHTLEQMQPWLECASRLPASLTSRRLACEIRWVLEIARALHRRLMQEDPLARRVRLARAEYLLCLRRALS